MEATVAAAKTDCKGKAELAANFCPRQLPGSLL